MIVFSAVTTILSLLVAAWALFVSWRTLRISARQAETAEQTRKSSIRPYVVAFTRSYPFHDGVYLMIANVGFGAARNVRARVIEGGDFESKPGHSLQEWKPLKEPTTILRVNERLWTMLIYYPYFNAQEFQNRPITIRLTYQDIEGLEFGPEEFRLDLKPDEGNTAVRTSRTVGGEVVEQRYLTPED